MKEVVLHSGGYRKYRVDVPESYSEAYDMLDEVMNPAYKARGKDGWRTSVAARVVYGLFWSNAANPTEALVRFLRELCKHEGEWHNDAEDESKAPSPRGRSRSLPRRAGGGAPVLGRSRGERGLSDP